MECDSEDSHASTQDRIPMSDTFKRVLEQLNLNSTSDDHLTNLDCLDGVTRLKRRGSQSNEDAGILCVSSSSSRRRASVCVGQIKTVKSPLEQRHCRRKSVQWIDERFIVPLAHEPSSEEKHAARIFIKTVPKSILKSSQENIVSSHPKISLSKEN